MPTLTSYYGPSTVITEQGVWVADGTRRICIFYTYETFSGILKYAACVFRCESIDCGGRTAYIEPTTQEMLTHSETSKRRFEMRPVIFQSNPNMTYEEIYKTIRHEMCHGYGVKGPRHSGIFFRPDASYMSNSGVGVGVGGEDTDDSGEGSELEFLTDSEPAEYSEFDWERVCSKPTRKIRYIGTTSIETYEGKKIPVDREFFIVIKGVKNTGELIYAAAISRRPSYMGVLDDDAVREHFETAVARLKKAPVAMVISEEYRHQLKSNAPHREDVTYEIIDSIMTKPGGRYLIKA
jgi:hypothetical protein